MVDNRFVAVAIAVVVVGIVTYFPLSLIAEIRSESITNEGTRGMYQDISNVQGLQNCNRKHPALRRVANPLATPIYLPARTFLVSASISDECARTVGKL